ncbi:magnesium chelatase subunit D family protein [Vallitalea maricola]|uniref:VWA domain-containing protein n=1 Tax=Vallitalea maricola TaxID=3074433 RepID=A0ACB5UEN1_9FIRM|nr:VWA domain-containing protein [Vallitalea sp. AN17-2]
MKRSEVIFPFAAIAGQEKVKKALILNAVNPAIGGVLISGEKGTAKSTLVRGLAGVIRESVVDLPLNITEDRLIGTIDIETAISRGKKAVDCGVLHKANGNILYVDEVNLLSEHIVNCLLEVSSSGINKIEREGFSFSHESKFILIGTMNPEEGYLRPQFIDRFGLYVKSRGSRDIGERKEIIKRRMEYEEDPIRFIEDWEKENHRIRDEIAIAREIIRDVVVDEELMYFAADIARGGNCSGHRAEISIVETAKAIAALDMRKNVIGDDIEEAASYSLPHRMREITNVNESSKKLNNNDMDTNKDETQNNTSSNTNKNETDDIRNRDIKNDDISQRDNTNDDFINKKDNDFTCDEQIGDNSKKNDKSNELSNKSNSQEKIEHPLYNDKIIPLEIKSTNNAKKIKGTGKRTKVKNDSLKGRYIKYSIPKGKVNSIAFDATFRAALPYQKFRNNDKVSIVIDKSDIREKIRERRTGSTILFVVDASGSMGTKQRMRAVKSAIISMLNDAYQKRDKVGMIAFRKNKAEVLLQITKSVDMADKRLKNIPTGGKTPLASGLYAAYELLKSYKVKEPDMEPLIVLVTDGKANVSLNNGKPIDDALHMAGIIRNEGIQTMVIDTESGFIQLGLGKKLSDEINGEYYKLEDLRAKELTSIVKG